MIDLKAIRGRHAQAKGLVIAGMRGGKTLLTNALADRIQLLALVDRMRALMDRMSEHAHAIDMGLGDRCEDDCPGCDYDEFAEELDAGGEGE